MIQNKIYLFGLFLVALLSRLCISIDNTNDDIAIMRQRVLELTIWPPAENISSTIEAAVNYSSTLNSSCYWPDINYTNATLIGPWLAEEHIFRVTIMLQALTVNGSTVNNDSKIWENTHCALNVWLINDWHHPNWWFYQIGIPLQVTAQLLMLGNNATSFELEKIIEMSYRAAWWIPSAYHLGANLVNMIQCEIYRSLATNNRTGIEEGFSRMWEDVAMSNLSAAGIQPDWGYHFHAYELLSGSYGLVWSNDILLFLACSVNTKYQPNDDTLQLFSDFLLKGDAWMIMTNEWDWQVRGRSIATPHELASHGFTTDWIRLLANVIKSQQTKVELLNFANRLDNLPHIPLVGNKHFFASDYMVHRRTNWTASLKTQSMRTLPTECILGMNIKDEHGGQGVLNIYREGVNDYFDIFPLFDWQAINGITVEHGIPLNPCVGGGFNVIRQRYVGGASDGQYGMMYMDSATHNLTTQRSWYFYDDAIIALATNLTLTTRETAWTTLASRLLPTGMISVGFFNSTIISLSNGNYSIPYIENKTSNVQWIHIGGSNIGYILQDQRQYTSIEIQLENKTGNYKDIGPSNVTVTGRMLTMAINHGVGPYTGIQYNYMIVPNVSVESMARLIKQYDEESIFSCISTNDIFHGTMWPSLKHASFVLWSDNATKFSCASSLFGLNIELNREGAFIFSETENDFTLTASHSKRWNSTVSVIVNRIGHGPGCNVSSILNITRTTMTVMLPPARSLIGQSVNITCKK